MVSLYFFAADGTSHIVSGTQHTVKVWAPLVPKSFRIPGRDTRAQDLLSAGPCACPGLADRTLMFPCFYIRVLFFLIFPSSLYSQCISILSYSLPKPFFLCDLRGHNASQRGISSLHGARGWLCRSDSGIKAEASTVSRLPSSHTSDGTLSSLASSSLLLPMHPE